MKRIPLAGLAALLVAGGALVGCHNNHQGPHYGGWGGCCSQGECCQGGVVPGSPGPAPMMYPAPATVPGGQPMPVQTSNAGGAP